MFILRDQRYSGIEKELSEIYDNKNLNRKERKRLFRKAKKDYEMVIKKKFEQELCERILINDMTFEGIIKEIEDSYNNEYKIINDEDYAIFELKTEIFDSLSFVSSSFINHHGKCNLESFEKLGYKVFINISENKMELDKDPSSFKFKTYHETVYEGVLDIDIYNKIMNHEDRSRKILFIKELYLIKGDDDNFSMFKMMNY